MIKDMDDKEFEKNEVALFENQFMQVFKGMAENKKQMNELKKQEDDFKGQLEKAMDEFHIKSIDNEYVRITRVPENKGKKTIDVAALEKEEPTLYAELLEDYPKTSGAKKAYIRFDVK